MLRFPTVLAVAATILLGVGGCGPIKEDKMASGFYYATKGYREAIRWGAFGPAAGFLHPDERVDVDYDNLENVRITGYEVIQPAVITPQRTAVQQVRIEYVLKNRQVLKSLTDRQEWRWDDEGSTWWLHSGLPEFDT